MRLSLQAQYAICGAFDLAYNGQGDPIQIRVISERQLIPTRYLEQIFQRMRRASIVVSKRGPGGGYTLARPASEIRLVDVIEAVEGSLADTLEMPLPEAGEAPSRPSFLWSVLADRLGEVLAGLSLDDLCRAAASADVERAGPSAPMYFI